MIITGVFLLLIGTNLSYSYPSAIKHDCESYDNTIIEEPVVTVDDVPCSRKLKELHTFIPAEIPSAPVLPPIKLSESPIIVQEVEEEEDCDNNFDEAIPPQPEPIITNLPTPPELPLLVSIDEEEDCDNVLAESIPSPPAPCQTFELPSRSYDIREEVSPCPSEIETPVLPNLPTPPELPPLVSVVEEEDCDNNFDEAIPPQPEPSQAFELPSRSIDNREGIAPCESEDSAQEEIDTPILKNLPTPPELPPLVSINEEEDCDNVLAESIPPAPEPCQTFELPSESYDINEEVSPCSSEVETPVLPNLPTPPELPPLVSVDEEEDCNNNFDQVILPQPEPSQVFELPSRSIDTREEIAPCESEDSAQEEINTPILKNLPTPPELPPLVSINEEEDCDNVVAESIPPALEPCQTFELPSESYDIKEEVSPCPSEVEIPVLPNLPTPPELPPLVSVNEEEDCDNNFDEAIPPQPEPSQAFELPSRSIDTREEIAPCESEDSAQEEIDTPILKNLPTPPELPPFVPLNVNDDCDTSVQDVKEATILQNIPTPPELPASISYNEEEECNTPDEEVHNLVFIPPAPEIPIIALPKLPLDIVLPKKKETEMKAPLPNVCVHNIVVERVVPNIICRKTNSSNKANLIPNLACKNMQ